ncbi:hypothetical protein HYQ19_gp051 [Arthrobacter phage DrYang]|uniref:Uncharacterized protein n=1 Tax=Arthrobacter phage DrYang TaxID=2686080 RepID=A0A6B9J7A5_9CAUD|nr:hypothetical protein HYQ19_gp051 [Arthrobacter phage DrYang]QGZ17150.1 hypothetical protein SEA_DRYANG_51 [Arthrobacter phage DrYang]
MSEAKPVWRGKGPHSVKGTAMEPEADKITAAYREALTSVAELMGRRELLIEKTSFLRGRTEYTLNYATCGHLSDLEKMALAHGGIPSWGGYVQGIRVTVFTD